MDSPTPCIFVEKPSTPQRHSLLELDVLKGVVDNYFAQVAQQQASAKQQIAANVPRLCLPTLKTNRTAEERSVFEGVDSMRECSEKYRLFFGVPGCVEANELRITVRALKISRQSLPLPQQHPFPFMSARQKPQEAATAEVEEPRFRHKRSLSCPFGGMTTITGYGSTTPVEQRGRFKVSQVNAKELVAESAVKICVTPRGEEANKRQHQLAGSHVSLLNKSPAYELILELERRAESPRASPDLIIAIDTLDDKLSSVSPGTRKHLEETAAEEASRGTERTFLRRVTLLPASCDLAMYVNSDTQTTTSSGGNVLSSLGGKGSVRAILHEIQVTPSPGAHPVKVKKLEVEIPKRKSGGNDSSSTFLSVPIDG